jgi:hypothetical protein
MKNMTKFVENDTKKTEIEIPTIEIIEVTKLLNFSLLILGSSMPALMHRIDTVIIIWSWLIFMSFYPTYDQLYPHNTEMKRYREWWSQKCKGIPGPSWLGLLLLVIPFAREIAFFLVNNDMNNPIIMLK